VSNISVRDPDTISLALPEDGSKVLDDRSQVVTNDGSVKVEVDIEDSKVFSPVSDFQCSICSLCFAHRGNLNRHRRNFHEDG